MQGYDIADMDDAHAWHYDCTEPIPAATNCYSYTKAKAFHQLLQVSRSGNMFRIIF